MQSRILKRLGLVLPVILLALAACSFRQQEAPSTTDLPEFQRVTVLQDTSIELLPGEHQNMELGSSAVSPDDPDAVPGIREARFEWFWEQRAYPLKTVPFMANNRALQQARSMLSTRQSHPWQSMGPAPLLEEWQNPDPNTGADVRTTASGRLTAIAFDLNNPNTMYVASAGGGVWKSTNKGGSFTSVTSSRPEFAFNSVAVDPQNSNVVYAGTGDLTGYYGNGILKSTDAGATWTLYGSAEFGANAVTQIIVHPTNSSRLYASTAWAAQQPAKNPPPGKGIFRSNDGGATWQQVLNCTPCGSGFTDLLMDPSNPQTLYAGNAGVGVFKSTDGGDTWNPLNDFAATVGRQNYSRLEMAIGSGAASNTLYAGIDGRRNVNGVVAAWGYVYRSTDGGQNWQRLDPNNTPNYCGGQCWYDNAIAVNPANANDVLLGGVDIYRTGNGGGSWNNIRQGVHVDQHVIVFDPADPGVAWAGNDGGLFRIKNGVWEAFNTGIGTLQFTGLGVHPTNANLAIGGMQDNSHAIFDGTNWRGFSFADGNKAEFDPFDPTIVYHGDQQLSFAANQGSTAEDMRQNAEERTNGISGNDNVEFYIPFEVDPSSQGVLYLGTDRVYRTANRGVQWAPISQVLDNQGNVRSIGVPPSNPNILYVGTTGGQIHKGTRDQNGQWNWANMTNLPLPPRFLSDIAIHPTNPQIVYLAYNGFSANTPGDPGHVFKSTDGGGTWTLSDGAGGTAFPDVPALTILIDPDNPTHIYVGTDIGVFRSTDGGASWSTFSQGLPPVPVTDLKYTSSNKFLWASTYGRSIFRTSLAPVGPTPTPTTGPAPTATSTNTPSPAATDTPTPTATPEPPSTGVAPGIWTGAVVAFQVASDESNLFNFQIDLNFSNICTITLEVPGPISIDGNGNFAFAVSDRGESWSVNGSLANQSASGTGTFTNIDPGSTMCGDPFTGTVNWTANWSASSVDPTPTPVPPTATPTPLPSSASGINGQVRAQGVGVAGVELGLFDCLVSAPCDPEQETPLMITTTDAGGYYDFTGAPALAGDEEYFVFYLNDEFGGNPANDIYLYRWFGESLVGYPGGSLSGGTFDISEVRLVEPSDGVTTGLPVAFTWTTRTAVPGENYAWQLLDLETGDSICESAPSATGSFILDQTFFDANCTGAQMGVEYGWLVWAIDGDDFDTAKGFGDSYYVGALTFSTANVQIYLPFVSR